MALIEPIAGRLVNLRGNEDETPEFKRRAGELPSIQLSERQVWDVGYLAVGAFSPLERFKGKEKYGHRLGEMRQAAMSAFPILAILPVNADATESGLEARGFLQEK